jgi:hypothetical protein
MFLLNALNAMFRPKPRSRRSRHQPRPRSGRRRLELEPLEDRALPSVTLTSSEAAPQLVGERITWTATATECGSAPVYQFSAAPHAGAIHVVRDFSPTNTFTWTPMQEGTYDILVTVKDGYQATQTTTAEVLDVVASRVNGTEPFISPTANPLVALYSAAPGPAGMMHVEFSPASGEPSWRSTNTLAAVPGKSTNFFVAGMLANTTYEMRSVRSDGTVSSPQLFTTGALPTTLTFPTFTVQHPLDPGSDINQDMIFHQFTKSPSNVPNPLATDLTGNVVWYYDASHSGLTLTFPGQSLVPGGTALLIGVDADPHIPNARNILREIDLTGDTVRETNLDAVNAELTAMGHDQIYSFFHDVQRLPNGETAVIGLTERTVNINGTPTDFVGMDIVVLDDNFQVAWVWDSFDHLDVNRGPVLGEVLQPDSGQPTASVPRLPAVDWLHLNAVSWSPADGNLVLSIRHLDWVIKIDYRNGEGDGHVIWRLGQDGDFTVNSTDPNPWFSHQHDAHYVDDTTMVLFDNGNTRRASDPTANSRGQVWKLDEETMTATLMVNADLGNWAGALGAAQRLSNGDYSFTMGEIGPEPPPPHPPAHTTEVSPDGTVVYDLKDDNQMEFRSFRIRTLYEGIEDVLAGAPRQVESVVVNDGSAQRSMVNSLTVTFNGAVTLDPGAFELVRQGGPVIQLQISQAIVDGHSVDTLTFVGAGTIGGSLADGHYTLTTHGGLVHDEFGQGLDGAGTGVAGSDRVDTFFRLFGDADGDGHVDLGDLLRFAGTFGKHAGDPGYLWYFDYDGEGTVDLGDLFQLLRRFGH